MIPLRDQLLTDTYSVPRTRGEKVNVEERVSVLRSTIGDRMQNRRKSFFRDMSEVLADRLMVLEDRKVY